MRLLIVRRQIVSYSLSSGPRFSKEHSLWNVPRLCPFVLLVKAICSASETVFRGTYVQWSTIFETALSGNVPCSAGVTLWYKQYVDHCFSNRVPRNVNSMVHDFRKSIVSGRCPGFARSSFWQKRYVDQCFSNWVPQTDVRGSER